MTNASSSGATRCRSLKAVPVAAAAAAVAAAVVAHQLLLGNTAKKNHQHLLKQLPVENLVSAHPVEAMSVVLSNHGMKLFM